MIAKIANTKQKARLIIGIERIPNIKEVIAKPEASAISIYLAAAYLYFSINFINGLLIRLLEVVYDG